MSSLSLKVKREIKCTKSKIHRYCILALKKITCIKEFRYNSDKSI